MIKSVSVLSAYAFACEVEWYHGRNILPSLVFRDGSFFIATVLTADVQMKAIKIPINQWRKGG